MSKIYLKRGNKNYKEKRMIQALSKVFSEKTEKDPTFSFTPANSFDELKKLHEEYCSEPAEFTEVKNNSSAPETPLTENQSNENTMAEEHEEPVSEVHTSSENNKGPNPLTAQNPKVRGYVLEGDFPGDKKNAGPAKTSFDEPVTFDESFSMPDPKDSTETNSGNANQAEEKKSEKKKTTKTETSQPPSNDNFNPDLDRESAAKKRKKTQRFAKSIVRITCTLLEKGIVWWATKEINDNKVTEYDISGEIDMDLLLELGPDQDVTVRDFFKSACEHVKKEATFAPQEQEELIEALTDVFLEKNIAPTPMQQLIMTAAEVAAPKVLEAMSIQNQMKQVIMQLKDTTAQRGFRPKQPAQQQHTPEPEQPTQPETSEPTMEEQETEQTETETHEPVTTEG